MDCVVSFPAKWIDSRAFEEALRHSQGPHAPDVASVNFVFPVDCKVMVDGAVRLLSLVNQLAASTRRVRLSFDQGEDGTMGYLNRMGFFDQLNPSVDVLPHRPYYSAARLHRGENQMLVEIERISRGRRDPNLPTRLSEAVAKACASRVDVEELKGAAWTIFAELIENIFTHSDTLIDGYAGLQVYQGGNRVSVAVSDSGRGIMETLRPALKGQYPQYVGMTDTDLLVEVFREGISRLGEDRGCGLKGCAGKAIKFDATLDVRLPNQRVFLQPSRGHYEPNRAYCFEGLPLVWGTHIAFGLKLSS
jgi:hypothetical protein